MFVFERNGTSWSQTAKLTFDEPASSDWYGISVDIDRDTLVVGFSTIDSGGLVDVYVRNGTNWVRQARLTGSDTKPFDFFGCSVAVSGDTLVVGAYHAGDYLGSGAAYVFQRNGTTWTQIKRLVARDGAESDHLGWSVAINETATMIVAGALHDDSYPYGKGAAYVFFRSPTGWHDYVKLVASDTFTDRRLGQVVAISGTTVLAGVFQDHEMGYRAGAAYLYELDSPLPFVVTNTDDSGAGSLRQAILDANANPGADTIMFDIPGAGPFTISPLTALPEITDPVIIDGTTQPGASCDSWPPTLKIKIDPAGDASVLTLAGGDSVVRGVVLSQFSTYGAIRITSDYNAVECSFIGTNFTGTSEAGPMNQGRAIVLADGASYNRIGTNGDGFGDETEGNVTGSPSEIFINGTGTDYNVVAGNHIHVDVNGTAAFSSYGEASVGISIGSFPGHNRIGTNGDGIGDDAERNVIGGLSLGIYIDDSSDNIIAGNDIGTDHTGTLDLHNLKQGIYLSNADRNVIGGTTQAEANRVAFQRDSAIFASIDSVQNTIIGNALYINAGMGIDLGGGGVNDNDLGDGDTGANDGQNYPVFTNATPTTIEGTLNSTPNATFTLHFYSNRVCDDTMHGEGETLLPATVPTVVTTNASGDVAFSFTFVNAIPLGYQITVTATDAQGNTSEFSRCTLPVGVPLSFTVTTTQDHEPGSLRQAIIDANMVPGQDTITFNIPGAGPHTIAPVFALPDITDPVIIDGTTQPGASCESWPPTLKIELAGTYMVDPLADGLRFLTHDSVLRGLVINRFQNSAVAVYSERNTVQCNFIGTNTTGTAQVMDTIVGVTVIENHHVIGTNGDGVADETERNLIAAVIGIDVDEGGYNQIAGNLIGTDSTGTMALPGEFDLGIHVQGGYNTLIGTNGDGISDQAERNVIANYRIGVEIDHADDNIMAGNLIGTDITGTQPLGNQENGILITNYSDGNTFGGLTEATGNVIAFNGWSGISFSAATGTRNRFAHNRIYANGGLGIDLGPNGVTPNDSGDGDTGTNNLQNYPVLTSATANTVSGTLNSTPNTTFTLEFFSNTTCDPSGYGEGETFQPTTTPATVTTDANGDVSFNFTFANTVPPGRVITATATDPDGNTSEFSACMAVSIRPTSPSPTRTTAAPAVCGRRFSTRTPAPARIRSRSTSPAQDRTPSRR